jgi:autotransporter-associated beta strand protein
MSAHYPQRLSARLLLAAAAIGLSGAPLAAADLTKANNSTALNLAGSYLEGLVPTADDTVVFDTTFNAGTGISLNYGANLSLFGLNLGAVTGTAGSSVNLGADNLALTLGAGGVNTTGTNMDWLLGPSVTLAADQTWTLAGGRYLRLGNAANAGVLNGSANLNLVRAGSGTTTLDLNSSTTGLTNYSGKIFVGEGVLARTSQNNAAAWGTGLVYLQGGSIGVGGLLDATKGNWNWNTGIVVGAQGGTIDNTNASGTGRTLTLNSVLTGSGNLTFANTPNLSLVNYVQKDSGLTGTVTIAANTQVRVGNSGVTGSLGTANIVINSTTNPAINIGRTGIAHFSNNISGAGRIDIANGITSNLLVFSGTNTFSGLAAIYGNAGTFVQVSSLSTTAGNLGAGTIALLGGSLLYAGSGETITRVFQQGATSTSGVYATGSGALVWNPTGFSDNGTPNARTAILGGTSTVQNSFGGDYGSLSATKANVAFRKANVGTWNLTAQQTYTGNTEIAGGTLRLAPSSATSPFSVSTNTLSFTGSGTLDLVGRSGASVSQTLGAVTLTAGNATLLTTLNSGTAVTLSTGAFSRSAGATLTFAGNSGAALIGTSQTNTNSIIGTGWAFIQNGTNSFDFAVAGASNAANVTALASYTTLTTAGANSATTNYALALSGTTTMAGAFTGNVLKLTSSGSAATWALGANAATTKSLLLTGTGSGATTLSGTAVLGNGTTGEFIVNNSSASNLTITAPLISSTATAGSLVKTGTGLVVVQPSTGNNAFTGSVFVNQGELRALIGTTAGTYTPLGTGAITVNPGATLRFKAGSTTNAFTYSNAVNLRDATFISDDGVATYTGAFNATGWNTFEVTWSTKNAVLSGVLSGSGFLNKTGNGALILSNAANTFTGHYVVSAGWLQAGTGATPATRLGNAAGVIINSGGTLRHDINANSGSTSLFTNSTAVIRINSGGTYNGYVTESASGGTIMTQTVPKFLLAGGTLIGGGSTGSALINFATHLETVAGTDSTIFQENNGGYTNNGMAFTGVDVSGAGNLTLTREGGGNTSRFWWLGWRSGNANAYTGNVTLSASTSPGDYYFGTVGGWGAGQLIASGAGASAILGDYSAQGAWATAGILTGTMHVLGGFQVGPSAQLRLLNRSDTQFVSAEIAGPSTLTGGTLGLAGAYGSPGAFIPFTGATWTVGGSAVSTIAAPLALNYDGVTFNVGDSVAGSGTDLLVSGQVRGSRQLTKSGAGTMTLAAANSHTGGFNVTAGTLALGNGGATGDAGSGALVLGASATLALNRSNNVSLANTLSGSGVVAKLASAGVATLSGTLSAFSGTLAVESGTSSVINVLALGSGVSTPGSATVAQFGALRSLGNVTVGNVTLASGGHLQFELGSPTLATAFFTTTGTVAFATGSDLVVSNSAAVNPGTYRLINYSAGAITLDGLGDISGLIARSLAPSRNTFTLSNNAAAGTLDLAVTGIAANLVWNGSLASWDAIQESGVGRAFTNQNDAQADWFYNFDHVTFDASAAGAARTIELVGTLSPGSVTVAGSDNYTFAGTGSLAGSANLVKNGTGTLRLENSGANALTGTMTVNGGKLAVTAAYAMSSGGITLNNGATLASSGNKTIGSSLAVNGAVTLGDSTDTGTLAFTSGVTLAQGASLTANVATTFSGAVTFGTELSIAGPAGVTLSGPVAGSFALSKAGTGTLILTGANTYSGGTNVTGGVLQFGVGGTAGALPAGAVAVSSGAELRLNRNDTTITVANALSGAGTVRLLSTGASGVGGYAFTGTNTSFAGQWIVGAGARLNGATAANLGSAAVSVLSSGNLYVSANYTLANNLTLAGRGWLEAAGELGALRLSGGSVTGSITLAGDASIAAYTSSGTLAGNIGESGGARKLTLGHAYTGSPGSGLGNSGGTLTLSGDNSYSGGTDLVGVVAVTAASSTALGSGLVTIGNNASSAATLALANGVALANAVTFGANAGSASGVIQLLGSASASIGGRVTVGATLGTGPLFGVGSGTLSLLGGVDSTAALALNAGNYVLAGGGTYPSLTLAGGSLRLGGTNGLGAAAGGAATFTLGSTSAATLDLNGFSQANAVTLATVSGLTVTNTSATAATLRLENTGVFSASIGFSGNLSLVLNGAGSKTLTSSNSHIGGTTVAAGSLSLTSLAPLGSGGLALSGGSLSLDNATAAVLSGALTGSGSLQKSGLGTLTLSDASAHTGALTVTQGGLVVSGTTLGGSSGVDSRLTVSDGASLSGGFSTGRDIRVVGGDGVISPGGLLRPGSGSSPGVLATTGTLELGWLDDIGGAGSTRLNVLVGLTSADRIDLTGGTLRLLGDVQVSFLNGGFGSGTYQILSYDVANVGNVLDGTLVTVGNYGHTTLSAIDHDVVAGTFSVTVSKANMIWTGALGSTVDATTANFLISTTSEADSLLEGDELIFDDTAVTRAVTLASDIPLLGKVTVDTTLGYAFSGAGGFAGDTALLVKAGTGTLTLGGVNTFGGGIRVTGGTLLASADTALGASAGTLTLGAGTTLRAGASFTLGAGRVVQLDGAASVEVDTGAVLAFGGAISGAYALTKTGDGTLSLAGTNTFTGGTILAAGTLELAANNTLAASGDLTVNAGTLALGATNQGVDSFTLAGGAVTSTGTLSATSASLAGGTLGGNLAASAATFSGTVSGSGTVSAAAYAFDDGATVASGLTLSGSGVIGRATSGTVTLAANLSHLGGVDVSAGTLVLSGANTYAGGTTLSGTGTIRVGSAGALGAASATLVLNGGSLSSDSSTARTVTAAGASTVGGNVTLGDSVLNGALTLANAFNLGGATRTLTVLSDATLSGALTNGGLVKAGAGTLTLSAANTLTAGLRIDAGRVDVTSAAAIGGGTVTLGGGAASAALRIAYNTTVNNAIVVDADATGLAIIGGSIAGSGSNTQYGGLITLGRDTVFLAGSADRLTFVNVISGAGGITIATPLTTGGRITFNHSTAPTANTFGGDITIQDGAQLQIGVASNTNNFAIPDTANIRFDAQTLDTVVNLRASGTGTGWAESVNALISNATGAGRIGLTEGTSGVLTIGAGDGSGNYSGTITGALSLTKTGSGTQTLSGATAHTGITTVTAGSLVLAHASALAGSTISPSATGSLVFASTVADNAFTVGGLTGSIDLALVNNAATPAGINLSVGGNNSDTTYSGVLSGAGSLTKLGTGTLTLSAANTFSGGITVGSNNTGTNDPSLAISNEAALGSGNLRVLAAAAYSATTYASAGSPFLRITPSSFNLANNIVMPGTAGFYAIQRGVSGDTSTTPGLADLTGVISGGATGVVLQFDHPTGGQNISTFQLSGANTFLGTLRINRGRLIVNHLSALGDAATIVQLETNANATDGNLVFNLGGSFANPILVATANNAISTLANNVTLSGQVSGGSAFAKIGSGTLTLAGTNTFSGGFTVNAGTLLLGSANALPAASGGLTVAGGILDLGGLTHATTGTLAVNTGSLVNGSLTSGNVSSSGNATLSASLSTAGTLTKTGAGTVTTVSNASIGSTTAVSSGTLDLAGANTLTGAATVSGGATLRLTGNNTLANITATSSGAINVQSGVSTAATLATSGSTGSSWTVATGATLNATNFGNSWNPTSFVIDGTLNLSSAAANAFNQSTNGAMTIAGAGTINVAGGYTNANASGTVTTFSVGRFNIGGGTSGVGITRSFGTIRLGATTLGVFGQNWNSAAAMELVNAATGTTFDTLDSADAQTARTITLSGTLSSTGKLNKAGAGTLIVSGTNSYSGGTSVTGGTLRFGAASLGSTGTVAVDGGQLEWAAGNTLDLSPRLALGASGGTLNTGANNVAFASGLSALGDVTKAGSGTLTLNALGTVAGAVAVNEGRLVLGNAAAVGDAAVALASSTTLSLAFDPASAVEFANDVTGAGTLELAAASDTHLVTLSGLSGFTGTLRLVSGYLDKAGYTGALTYVGGRLADVTALGGTLIIQGNFDAAQGLPSDVLLSSGGTLDFATASGAALDATIRYSGGSLANAAAYTGTLDVQVSGLTLAANSLGSGTVRLGNDLSVTLGAGFDNDILLEGTAAITNDLTAYAGTVILGNLAAYNLGTNPDFARTASFRLTSGSRLAGQGAIGDLTIENGGTLAPGNSPGTLITQGNATLLAGGTLDFEVLSAVGALGESVAGTDYDTMIVTGELNLAALSSDNRFVLNLTSLGDAETVGPLLDFDPLVTHSFTLIDYGTLDLGANTSFGANLSSLFTLNTSGFLDQNGNEVLAGWSVLNDTDRSALVLTYSAIPEPSTYGLILGALALAGAAVRRRRKLAR